MKATAAFSVALVISAAFAFAKAVTIKLPPETGTFKSGPGVQLMQKNCLTCHSVEYVGTQPRMPRKYWEATVKKMRDKFGAPIPDSDISTLVDYLTTNYGEEQ
jgi:hypothetical protein